MGTAENTEDKAPWTSEDFDAEKAWKLVSNLKEERNGLKAALAEAKAIAEQVPGLEAKTAELQKAFEGKTAELAEYTRNATKSRLLSERGIPESFLRVLTGDTEEDWEATADLLASWHGKQDDTDKALQPDPVQSANTVLSEEQQRVALANAIFKD